MLQLHDQIRMLSVVVLVLAHQGYWFGGQANELRISWPITAKTPDAKLHWRLMFADTVIANGACAMPRGGEEQTLRLQLPATRVRTTMTLRWRLIANDDDAEREDAQGETAAKSTRTLAEGRRPLHVFPDNLLASAAIRYQRHAIAQPDHRPRLTVVDPAGNLRATLEQANIPHQHVESLDMLGMQSPDVLLIAANALDPHDQPALRTLANEGADVMVFAQSGRVALAGLDMSPRPAPPELNWRASHPMLARLRTADLRSWTQPTNAARTWHALTVPAAAPVLAVAQWPPEVRTDRPAPRDAAVVSQTVGKGRVVLWQIPLGDWDSDPRSQALLAGVLDYLPTAPQPTPPLGQRGEGMQKADRWDE